MHRKNTSSDVKNTCERGENYGLGMCRRQGNTCEKRKKKKQVCADGKGIHAKREKRRNRYVPEARDTCEKRKKMKQVCARGDETHAREGELWIRYVPEVREYMQEREK